MSPRISKYKSIPVGEVYNNWTVISPPVTNKDGAYKLQCRCECGQIQDVLAYRLVNGNSKQCRECARGSSDSISALKNRTYRNSKREAQNKSQKEVLEYCLTTSSISESFSTQNSACALTGQTITYTDASAIRIDNTSGYIPANTLWVSKDIATVVKGSGLDATAFVNLCQTVTSAVENNPTLTFFNRRETE